MTGATGVGSLKPSIGPSVTFMMMFVAWVEADMPSKITHDFNSNKARIIASYPAVTGRS